jgi:hypothetical protein
MDPTQLTTLLAGGGTALALVMGCGITVMTLGFIALSWFIAIKIRNSATKGDKVMQEQGIKGEATILNVWDTGVRFGNAYQMGMQVEVRVPGREPYQTQTRASVPIVNIPQFQPGAVIPVKVHPNDPSKVLPDIYA